MACLLIIVFHARYYFEPDEGWPEVLAGVLSWCWIGVPIFFVISGYCITASCDNCRRKGVSAREYFTRRFRRIYPAYWAFIVLTVIAVAAGQASGYPELFTDDKPSIRNPFSLSPSQWLGNIGLYETWRPHVAGDARALLVGHAWTLCYEEQFYAVCGVALLLFPRRMFGALAAITAAVVAVGVAKRVFEFTPAVEWFFFDGYWLIFAFGGVVYYRQHYAPAPVSRLISAGMLLGFVPALYVAYLFGHSENSKLSVGFAFAVLAALLYRWDHRIADIRWLKPFAWCGTMCYSIYLVHWPVTKALSRLLYDNGIHGGWGTLLVTMPVCVAASLLAAWPFHIWIERRFMTPVPPRPDTKTGARAKAKAPSPTTLQPVGA